MIRRANGTVEEIGEDIAGFPLGIMPDGDYKQTEVKLQPRRRRRRLLRRRDRRPEPPRGALRLARATAACSSRLAETPGGPEAVGRAILQDIREFSAGHTQVDDITLICFGPLAR